MPHDIAPGLLVEGGWRPLYEPAIPEQAVLAETIQQMLPDVVSLLWNVRNDLPVLDMAEMMVERMRLLGPAGFWRSIEALERCLSNARVGPTPMG